MCLEYQRPKESDLKYKKFNGHVIAAKPHETIEQLRRCGMLCHIPIQKKGNIAQIYKFFDEKQESDILN